MKAITVAIITAVVASCVHFANAEERKLYNSTSAFTLSVEEMEKYLGKEIFVYDPAQLNSTTDGNITFGNSTSQGGASQRLTSREWVALEGAGQSLIVYRLAKCSTVVPTLFPFGSAILYATSATNMTVGFLTEDRVQVVNNNITTGMAALFPQGLMHWVKNMACSPANFIISVRDETGKVISGAATIFDVPPDVLAPALNKTIEETMTLLKSISPDALVTMDSDCNAKCGA